MTRRFFLNFPFRPARLPNQPKGRWKKRRSSLLLPISTLIFSVMIQSANLTSKMRICSPLYRTLHGPDRDDDCCKGAPETVNRLLLRLCCCGCVYIRDEGGGGNVDELFLRANCVNGFRTIVVSTGEERRLQ